MPCTPDPVCNRIDTNTYAQENIAPTGVGAVYANMGWVGFAKLKIPSLNADNILRCTSASINLSQDITMPAVIDGRIDRTVYQLGPKQVEGTLSLPVVADVNPTTVTDGCPVVEDLRGLAGSLLNNIWCWATARGPQGRLLYNDARIELRYANHSAYIFDNTIVNTLSLKVAQSDMVTLDIGVMGRGRTPASEEYASVFNDPKISDYLAPARVLTWNDVTINGVGGCSNPQDLFFSNQVREFSMEINNNAERYYSLNGSLFPMDINVSKREISGSLTLLGLNERLRILAETNQNRFTEKNEIRIAMYVGGDSYSGSTFTQRDWLAAQSEPANSIFYKKLTSVVFYIEEQELSNDVYQTTVKWVALANDQTDYRAISPDACGFPNWA